MYPRVTGVKVVPPYRLTLTFADGTTGTVDCAPWVLEDDAGVFGPLRDPALFAQVFLDQEAGTVAWPNGADVDPDTLYEEARRSAIS
jgi:hypothetical protein